VPLTALRMGLGEQDSSSCPPHFPSLNDDDDDIITVGWGGGVMG